MPGFYQLLRENRNYRYTWFGQIVSEIGDHFNNIAVFSLALHMTGSGLVVTGVMLSRALPAVAAGPIAGVLLDRMDRRRIMIASDLIRFVIALLFILCVGRNDTWLLYLLSGILMFASPFFTSGRAAMLPTIANKDELHTANSVTQSTQWTTTAVGAFLAGSAVMQFGYKIAFVFNALSFLFSALCISQLQAETAAFRVQAAGPLGGSRRTALARVFRRTPLHAIVTAHPRDRVGGSGMGDRRRSGTDSIQPVRRVGVSSRSRGNRANLGRGGHRARHRRYVRALVR